MFPDLSPRTKAATYAVLAVLLCVAVSFLTRTSAAAAGALVMATPVAAAVIMLLVVTRDGWQRAGWAALGLRRAGFRYWPIALGAPIAVVAASESVVALTGLTHADLSPLGSLPEFLVKFVVVFAMVGLWVTGEEVGWRGYMLPVLQQDGRRFAAARVGLAQGLWHLPLVYIVTDGYLTEGNRWLIVPVFLAVLTTAGVFYGWLRDRTGSVWPAVLTHTAFNVALGIAADTMLTADPDAVALISREAGIATLGVLVLFTVWLTTRHAAQPPATLTPAPHRDPRETVAA